MKDKIKKKDLKEYASKFYGFGSWKADFYFIGMEFGGKLTLKRVAEWNKKNLDSAKNYHKRIGEGKYFREKKPVIQRTYGKLFRLIAEGNTLDDIRNFQLDRFGLINGDNCFIDLSVLPCANINEFKRPKRILKIDKSQYLTEYIPLRSELIAKKIQRHKPNLVVLYGLNDNYFGYLKCLLNCSVMKSHLITNKRTKGLSIFWKKSKNTTIIQVRHPTSHHTTNEYFDAIKKKLITEKVFKSV